MNNYAETERTMMRSLKTLLIAAAMLLAACGGSTSEPVPPDDTIPLPTTSLTTVTTQEPTPTTTEPETTIAVPDPVAVEPDGCPEGTHSHDTGECHPDDTPTITPTVPEVEVAPKVVLDEKWWRPRMGEDAVALTDPATTGADKWHRYDDHLAVYGPYTHDVYYFFNSQETDPDYTARVRTEESIFYQIFLGSRDLMLDTDWTYFPYRYDVGWSEYPTTIRMVATYALGEEIELLVRHDGLKWDIPETVEVPDAPPIRPTTPFAEARWADTAEVLGRDCPPVEDLWEQGKPVSDECTLEAIHTALTWVWSAPSDLRQRAIRDGHVLTELFYQLDNTEDPILMVYSTEEGRAGITAEFKDARWVGGWPGASIIKLEYRAVYPDWTLTPELRATLMAHHRELADQGFDIPQEWLEGNYDTKGGTDPWDNALMVRTADGTWRMSYRSFCRKLATTINLLVDYECPDDPTPHFPDSDMFDKGIQPPNTLLYYLDPRDTAQGASNVEGFRYDNTPSRTVQGYLGVPPS